jgi:hypothetical protein
VTSRVQIWPVAEPVISDPRRPDLRLALRTRFSMLELKFDIIKIVPSKRIENSPTSRFIMTFLKIGHLEVASSNLQPT